MLRSDWSCCPHCQFPSLATHLKLLITNIGQCPMCSEPLDELQVFLTADPDAILKGIREGSKVQEPSVKNASLQQHVGGLVI